MKLGINLMAWSDRIGQEELANIPRLAQLGYNGIELPIFLPELVDAAAVRAELQASGLECTVSSALPRAASLLEPDRQPAALDFIDRCCAAAATCSAQIVCGPFYAPVGQLAGRPRTLAEWDSCVRGLQAAGDIAAGHGVSLAIEPLNRFETYFLNTAADALLLVEQVGHPAVGVLLDTFHMNIEEKDPAQAVRQVGPRIFHFHASENDRGIIGSGHINWPAMAATLLASGYADLPESWVVAETFSSVLPELAAATAIWRRIIPDPWIYASESLEFMRQTFGGVGLQNRDQEGAGG